MNALKKPRCLDLFCGIGGLALGLERAGLACVGGVDHWMQAGMTFEQNLAPLRCFTADLMTTNLHSIERHFGVQADEIDVVTGGLHVKVSARLASETNQIHGICCGSDTAIS